VPISYTLEPLRSTGLVRVTMTGLLPADALASHLLYLSEQRLFGLPEFVDMRAARLGWSGEEIRWITQLVAVLRKRYGPAVVSVLADGDDTFDILIQYLLAAGDNDPGLGLFRDLREAEGWLHDREFSRPAPDLVFSSARRVHGTAGPNPEQPPVAGCGALGYARVRPGLARSAIGLDPARWYPVIEQPADVLAVHVEGVLWLNDAGQVRRVPLRLLEVIWGGMSPPRASCRGDL
jgi:hypothetical protein